MEINGEALKAIRQLNGYGLKELADASGVSMSYICEIEKGTKKRVRPPMAKRLADACGVPVAALGRSAEDALKAVS